MAGFGRAARPCQPCYAISESPGLERGADAPVLEACAQHVGVDGGLLLLRCSITRVRTFDIHFGDVDLNSQPAKARNVLRDERRVQWRTCRSALRRADVHLEANAVDRYVASDHIGYHGIDKLSLRLAHLLGAKVVVEEQRGGVRLARGTEGDVDAVIEEGGVD